MNLTCRGCGQSWNEEKNSPCACTCKDGDERYEDWVESTCLMDVIVDPGPPVATKVCGQPAPQWGLTLWNTETNPPTPLGRKPICQEHRDAMIGA